MKSAGVRVVLADELEEFLRGVAAQGINGNVWVFGGHHFEEDFAVFLDLGRSGVNFGARNGLCRAGGRWVSGAFDFDEAKTTAAKGFKARIVTECGNGFSEAPSHFVKSFAGRKVDEFSVQSDLVCRVAGHLGKSL